MLEINNPDLSPNFIRPRRKISRYVLWTLLLAVVALTIIFVRQKAGWHKAIPYGLAAASRTEYLEQDAAAPPGPRGFWSQLKNLVANPERMLKGEAENRINILLLGIGGKGHEGPDLTDTIILASLQPSANQLAMLSVPRDLSVEIPGFGWRKINSANAYGEAQSPGSGAQTAIKEIEKIFNLPIHYYLRLDFTAFHKIVDELGGVKIYVDRAFSDPFYPAADGRTATLTFEQGWQTMDGERALRYVRSRQGSNGEGSDFARSRRQQKFLLALKEKVLSLNTLANPNRFFSIAEIVRENLQTNIAFWEAQRLFRLARKINYETVITRVLDDSENGLLVDSFVSGAALLEPRGGSFEPLARLAKNIFNQERVTAAALPPAGRPLIEIQNGTWAIGLTAKIKKELEDSGVAIARVTNANSRSLPQTIIYDLSKGAYRGTVVKIQGMLRAAATTAAPPAPLKPETQADILIILGKDRD